MADEDSLEERKFLEECRKALRDEELRAGELRLRRLELRLNRGSRWHELLSPLGVAAIAGLVGIVGSLVTTNLNRALERERNEATRNLERDKQTATEKLERQKQESYLILKIAEQSDLKQRAANLLFFAEAGYLGLSDAYTKHLRDVAGLKEGEVAPPPSLTSLVPTPEHSADGPKPATQSQLIELFGKPGQLTQTCGPPSERMKALLVLEDVGGFKLHAIRPVVEAVREIMASIRQTDPKLYSSLKSLGALCIREVRGAPGRFSSHSFGIAVDFAIEGALQAPRSGNTPYGLILLSKHFEKQGFVWVPEEGVHFEASAQLLERWKADGRLQ